MVFKNQNERRRGFSSRRAFTLVELLVVIAIIGVLIGLLLPAVQAARESARRTKCSNNLKQLALALHGYHDALGSFPTGLTQGPHNTWVVRIMPYLELKNFHDLWDFNVGYAGRAEPNYSLLVRQFPVLTCGSDEPTPLGGWGGRSNYVACFRPDGPMTEPGVFYDADKCNNSPAKNPGTRKAMFNVNVVKRMSQVTDGMSNTIAFSEVISGTDRDDSQQDIRGCWWYPWGMQYTHHRGPNTRIPDAIWVAAGSTHCNPTPDAPCAGDAPCHSMNDFAARSKHPGGVNAAHGDGSVSFFTDGVDIAVWQALASIDGGEATSQP